MTGVSLLMSLLIIYLVLPLWSMYRAGPVKCADVKRRDVVWLGVYIIAGVSVMRIIALILKHRGMI